MSSRLQLIETKLSGINAAAFQNLCDAYLKLEEEVISFNKPGSQFKKQKTTSGTPDTFFRRKDGSLFFVEHTTKADGIVEKIKGDIDSCVNTEKTGVDSNEISKIIICINLKLNAAQETEVFEHAKANRVQLQVIGLDTLAQDICYKYLILAKDYLGVALDTGQILSIDDFVKEYNNKGGNLSTPLDNEFLNRKKEMESIKGMLSLNDLVIINGASGVGKTKIAIEAIKEFTLENNNYNSYVISKKDVDIFEDLKIHLQSNKNYILLIDDANRQLQNFKQILGVFKGGRTGKIKLVITVRDYAFEDIQNQCSDFEISNITINKFTDEEIEKIISSDTFKINHHKYQHKIKEISDGNARLAIMAARLANKEQWAFIEGDVFGLYDTYFQTFIKDIELFQDQKKIRILGLISFFFTLNTDNKPFIEKLLKNFEIEEHEFFDTIQELEKMELLETKYNVVRVSEQIMATYFFYKVFIKDDHLSLRKLLDEYYNNNYFHRFRESIISSNNLFYYTNQEILKKLNITLSEYASSIDASDEKVVAFYNLFWVYKREDFLLYYHNKVKGLPEPENAQYNTEESKEYKWEKDEVIESVSKLFNQMSESFLPALELAFEFVRKKPEAMPDLIKVIKDSLVFDDDDYRQGFIRQIKYFELLIVKISEAKPHYILAFFASAKYFTAHHYNTTRSGRKNSFIFGEYPIPFNEPIKQLRSSIWNTVFDLFDDYPKESFEVIRDFRPGFKSPIHDLIEWDFEFLFPFLNANLDINNFEHVYFVQNTMSWISNKASKLPNVQALRKKLMSNDYKVYRKLDFSAHRGKEEYQFKDSDEFRRLKENDVKRNFIFKNENDITNFLNTFNRILLPKGNEAWFILQSIDIIAEENFRLNHEMGIKFFKCILENFPVGLREIYRTFVAIANSSEEYAIEAWTILDNWEDEQAIFWKFTFLKALPDNLINPYFYSKLMESVYSIDRGIYLDFQNFERFIAINKKVVEEILEVIVEKNEKNNLRISLPFHFFENYASKLSSPFELIAKAYLQFENLGNVMDSNREGLKSLMTLKPDFLLEYIKANYPEGNFKSDDCRDQMGFVWEIVSLETIEKSISHIIDNVHYFGVSDHPIKMFFYGTKEDQKPIIIQFLKNYIIDNNSNTNRMNAIFSVIRKRITEEMENLYHHYLSVNKDEEMYKSIMWRGNGGGVYSGDTIFGEIQANDWDKILKMTERHPSQLELIPIKAFLKKQVEYGYKCAETERKHKFIDSNY